MIVGKMSKSNPGNLGYIPAEVLIVKLDEAGIVTRYKKTFKPKSVLILKPGADLEIASGENYCEVLYNGEKWFVKDNDISIISSI